MIMLKLNGVGLGLIVALLFPVSALPQSGASSGGGGQSITDEPESELMTTSTVRNVQSVETECLHRAPVYRTDCLRQGLELVWRRLPYHGDYGRMRAAIQESTSAIAAVVDANADRAAPRLDSGLSSNPRFQARRHYTAILSGRLEIAQSTARQALAQLGDNLDHIDAGSGEVSSSYAAVAKAFREAADAF
jgi:hypothetical protein